jgi:hypothetical protein
MVLELEKIKKVYPWAFIKNQNMVIGDDLDAIISSCFLHHYLGWEIKGFYVKYNKLFIEKELKNWEDCIFVDLDIAQNNIKSIGHHILQINSNDSLSNIGHNNSLNPNILRGKTMETFRTKYPLGTIHFLMWIHQKNIPIDNDLKNMLWMPDSSWINGQSHRFKSNVEDWIGSLNLKELKNTFSNIDTLSFENIVQKIIYPSIINTGFTQGTGQVSSKNLKLTGFQCQFTNPDKDKSKLKKIIELICDTFGWDRPLLPNSYVNLTGERTSSQIPAKCFENGLSSFIINKNIFSYVIPNYGKINYTIFK